MELTTLDTELVRLHQTLGELIRLGLVEAVYYPEGNGIGPTTRYRLTGRPGDEEEDEQEEAEAPVRSLAVPA